MLFWSETHRGKLSAVLLSCLLFFGAAAADASPSADSAFDPRALDLLRRMTDAYLHLPALDQKTEVRSKTVPIGTSVAPAPDPAVRAGSVGAEQDRPGQVVRLAYAAPNRLRIEIEDGGAPQGAPAFLCVCDGKFCWTFQAEKNVYTKEKLPETIHEFSRLSYLSGGGLEMALLMGANPFGAVNTEMQTLQCEPEEIVNGTPSEVVSMRSNEPNVRTETRLYIGKADLLLRRMIVETTPVVHDDKPVKTGSAFDELLESAPPRPPVSADPSDPLNPGGAFPAEDPPSQPVKTRSVYDYIVKPSPSFDGNTFAYAPPASAFCYGAPIGSVKPRTLKQRIAEIAAAARKRKPGKPHTVRF